MVEVVELKNGIRIVYQYMPSSVSCCGVYLDVGSRDEDFSCEGVAHLIEHMMFKGTADRSYLEIINYIENVGGDFNAYTSKEETCLYVTLLNEYVERSLDVLSDVVFNSIYPELEIKKEKEIIVDEINSYKDSPSELIFDEFEEFLYEGNSLAHNILGSEASVDKISRADILNFCKKNYTNDRIIVSYVGGVPFDKFIDLANLYFVSERSVGIAKDNRQDIVIHKPFVKRVKRDAFQSHCMIGTYAFGILDDLRLPTVLLNNLLGGSSFNSILNLKLREENGLTYNIESSYTSYSDCGQFSVYFGTDEAKIQQCLDIIKLEFDSIKKNGLASNVLQIAKTQLSGQLALSVDSKTGLMISNAKSLLYFNRIDTLPEIIDKIHEVTNDQIVMVADRILDFDSLSVLRYQ